MDSTTTETPELRGETPQPSTGITPDRDESMDASEIDELEAQRERTAEAVRVAQRHGEDSKAPAPTDEQEVDAMAYFLAAETPDGVVTLKVDVGIPGAPQNIFWKIRAVDAETLKMIRQTSQPNRRARRSRGPAEDTAVDNQEANARIVVAGSVYPDFIEVARMKIEAAGNPRDANVPDPLHNGVLVLKHRLSHRPGLIDQISEHILTLSGYDEDAVQHHMAGKA